MTYTITQNKKGRFLVKDENNNIVSSHTWMRFAEEKVTKLEAGA